MQTKDHEIYISYSISPTEYWIQFKADEDLINEVDEALVQHMERTPLKVECPVVGQIYAMEHPILGGHYRGRVSSLNGDTVVACFVDYGDFVPVSMEKIFLLPAGLELLHPLAARCRSKRRYGSSESKKSFISITSDFEAVFRASFGPIISKSVREVEALFLNGKNIEKDIFPGSDKQVTFYLLFYWLYYLHVILASIFKSRNRSPKLPKEPSDSEKELEDSSQKKLSAVLLLLPTCAILLTKRIPMDTTSTSPTLILLWTSVFNLKRTKS